MSYILEEIIPKDVAASIYNDKEVRFKKIFDLPQREEMNKILQKKINGIIKNKRLRNEPEVKELINLILQMANQFDKVVVYAFDSTDMINYQLKKAGII